MALNDFLLLTEGNIFLVSVVDCVAVSLFNVDQTGLVLLSRAATLCFLKPLNNTHTTVGDTSLLVKVLVGFFVFLALPEVFRSFFNGHPLVVRQKVLCVRVHIRVHIIVTVIAKVCLVI